MKRRGPFASTSAPVTFSGICRLRDKKSGYTCQLSMAWELTPSSHTHIHTAVGIAETTKDLIKQFFHFFHRPLSHPNLIVSEYWSYRMLYPKTMLGVECMDYVGPWPLHPLTGLHDLGALVDIQVCRVAITVCMSAISKNKGFGVILAHCTHRNCSRWRAFENHNSMVQNLLFINVNYGDKVVPVRPYQF